MELDERIIDRKYIFDCFNADKAKEYIGEDCYMTSDLEIYKDLDRLTKYHLDRIDDNSFFYNEEEDEYFDYCLPVRFVKPVEKNEFLRKENERLQKLVEVLQEENKSLESIIALQRTIRNPFTPWTNCCASIKYPDGFNPQSNWCRK